MRPDIELDTTVCGRYVGRLRLLAQVFEYELRDEFIFDDATQSFWLDRISLLTLAIQPLESRLEDRSEFSSDPDRPEPLDYYHYVVDTWLAAADEVASTGDADGSAPGEPCKPIDRLFRMLSHLLDARYGLKLWVQSIPEQMVLSAAPEFVDPRTQAMLESYWADAKHEIDTFRSTDDGADFHLHLGARKLFLTAITFAVIDPSQFERSGHAAAIEHLERTISLVRTDFYRNFLLHKLYLLKQLTPLRFEEMSLSPTGYPGSRER